MSDEKRVVGDNDVVSMEYTLTVDGEVVDSSEGHGPVDFIQGQHHIIPGLEKALYGMAVGETKEITVSPEEGYGQPNPEAFMDVPKSEFPPEIPLEPGVGIQLRDPTSGQVFDAFIEEVGEETVRLNFNHPLAGKELHFQVKVVGIREATPEEISHGHVHHH